jgi:geranylgeranyl reductase family protein
MTNRYDLIIIGAGPSGACAGYAAASRGLRTLIIEKRKLPRYKTCGGGLPLTLGSELPALVPEAFVEATVTHLRHTWNFKKPHLAPINPDPEQPPMSLWMVQRSIFDNALTERAARAGCDVRDGVSVESVQPDGETAMQVTTSNGEKLTASYVIGADGANGIVARSVGLRKERPFAIALEAEIPHTWGEGHESLRPEVAHLEYAVKLGYAWIFPKAHHLSVGAGTFGKRSTEGRGQVRKEDLQKWVTGYLKAMKLKVNEEEIEYHGHPLPLWNGTEPIHALGGRVLLVGDAAGLVNPLFGDGISYACRSGALAGESIAAGEAARWTTAVSDHFGAGHDAALTISRFFYQFPSLCYNLAVKRPNSSRTAARLISGDLSFAAVLDRLPWRQQMVDQKDTETPVR